MANYISGRFLFPYISRILLFMAAVAILIEPYVLLRIYLLCITHNTIRVNREIPLMQVAVVLAHGGWWTWLAPISFAGAITVKARDIRLAGAAIIGGISFLHFLLVLATALPILSLCPFSELTWRDLHTASRFSALLPMVAFAWLCWEVRSGWQRRIGAKV